MEIPVPFAFVIQGLPVVVWIDLEDSGIFLKCRKHFLKFLWMCISRNLNICLNELLLFEIDFEFSIFYNCMF